MITTYQEFTTANNATGSNRLALGADIWMETWTETPPSLEIKRGKVVIPDGWKFIKGKLVTFASVAAGTGGRVELTLASGNTINGFEAGQYVTVKQTSALP